MGSINPLTNEVRLQTLFVVPDAGDLFPRTPGAYAIVLRDAVGAELARYPFTPAGQALGRPRPSTRLQQGEPEEELLAIRELVPYVAGTVRVDIEGPSGLLKTVTAGSNPPTVQVSSPNGGEFLNGATVPVSWTASDADGDPLRFNVQYSRDNGATWEMLAQDIDGQQRGTGRQQRGLYHAGAVPRVGQRWHPHGLRPIEWRVHRAQPCAGGDHRVSSRRQHRGHQPDGDLRGDSL